MFTVTDAAVNFLKEHLHRHRINAPIRITRMHDCCRENTLRFTLGTSEENDLIFPCKGITFLINRDLSIQCGRIRIDFDPKFDYCPCTGHNGGICIESENFPNYCCRSSCRKTCKAICRKKKESLRVH
jgi:Fe-S cluster assembly iron-binding protein IscA